MSTPKTILLVEDDLDIQSVISMVLELDGYKVKLANNGVQALEFLSREKLPDLILLDMRMPIMDGWQFASEFYKIYGRSVPIIVVTAAADAEQRAIDIQANGWLGKPFDLAVFQDLVKKHLR